MALRLTLATRRTTRNVWWLALRSPVAERMELACVSRPSKSGLIYLRSVHRTLDDGPRADWAKRLEADVLRENVNLGHGPLLVLWYTHTQYQAKLGELSPNSNPNMIYSVASCGQQFFFGLRLAQILA